MNKFQRAKDAMEYARKSAAESATATVSKQPHDAYLLARSSISAFNVIFVDIKQFKRLQRPLKN